MKFIYPNVEILEQGPGLQGVYEAICKAASTCYKSEAKTGESAKAFVDTLIKNKHFAMLEFGTVYLQYPEEKHFVKYYENPYSTIQLCENHTFAITTNYRVLVENNWLDDLKYLCEPTESHRKKYSVLFTTSIGIGREFTRHRVFSFAQESTRYCNYSKDKFEAQLTFILPLWSNIGEADYTAPLRADELNTRDLALSWSCYEAEKFYFDMLEDGCTPQQAREVLPLCTKSELCMCGFEGDWKHFFDLRLRGTTGKPHPDAKCCAELLHNKFTEKGITL